LSSNKAIKSIVEFNPDAKFIVMLRNPCDMVYSMHSQIYFTGDETERDFIKAWNLSDERALGRKIPHSCREPQYLQYKQMGLLGKQVNEMLKHVSPENVVFVLLEELNADTNKVVNEVVNFLGLPPLKNLDSKVYNRNETPRIQLISQLYHKKLPNQFSKIFRSIKKTLGIENFGVRKFLQKLNTTEQERVRLDHSFRKQMLKMFFEDDIKLLSELTRKDLSSWLK